MTKSERLIRTTAIEKSPTTSLQQCQWKRTWFEGTPSGFTSVQRWSWLRSVDGAWTQVHCKDTRSSKDHCAFFSYWAKTGTTPSILKQVKMVYVPKVNKLELGAVAIKALRPTTVFSTGGAFSSTCPFLRLWILCVLLCQRTFVAGDGLGQKSKLQLPMHFWWNLDGELL